MRNQFSPVERGWTGGAFKQTILRGDCLRLSDFYKVNGMSRVSFDIEE